MKKYHFVRFNGCWYLKVESIQDIMDHYHTILAREFKEGFEDRKKSTHILKKSNGEPWIYHEHPETDWNNSVVTFMPIMGKSWLGTADFLERKTVDDRVRLFNKGYFIYLKNGLPYYLSKKEETYIDEVWKDNLDEWPSAKYNIEDVRYIQWNGGKHWYAKVGREDIVDKYGNQKWNNKEDAEKAAKWFIENT